MCVARGAPRKPVYGACNETHQKQWRKYRIPIMGDLCAQAITDKLDTMVELKYREEWRYC